MNNTNSSLYINIEETFLALVKLIILSGRNKGFKDWSLCSTMTHIAYHNHLIHRKMNVISLRKR